MVSSPLVIRAHQGRYEIIRRLAAGGMAEVFLAKHIASAGVERIVVLKSILPSLRDEAEFVEAFLSEGRLATQLTHPNIVQVFEVGTSRADPMTPGGEAGPFMTMEYLEGADVRTLIKEARRVQQKLGVAEAVSILAQSAHGLGYAHRKSGLDGRPLNVVHRDISPHNLFVTFDGVAKVLDFGIAKSAAQLSVTRGGVMKGKLGYMAPEQVRGQPLDRRADLFALGIVLWEALTTERLFFRDNDAAILYAILNDKPRPPSSMNPAVPRSLDEITLRLLQPDPARRFDSAEDLALALESVLHQIHCASPSLTVAARVRALMPQGPAVTQPEARSGASQIRVADRTASIAGVPDSADEPDSDFGPQRDAAMDSAATRAIGSPPSDAYSDAFTTALTTQGPRTPSRAWIALATVLLGLAVGGAIVLAQRARQADVVASSAPGANVVSPSLAPPQNVAPPLQPVTGAMVPVAASPSAMPAITAATPDPEPDRGAANATAPSVNDRVEAPAHRGARSHPARVTGTRRRNSSTLGHDVSREYP